ncbi:MAG: hypothetical protein ACM3JB_11405 [Acidobacteriaceae bacterium]
MRRVLLSITLLLSCFQAAQALNDREAMVQLLMQRGALRTVAPGQVEFAAKPSCSSEHWSVRRVHFDPALHAWAVELACPRIAAVPVLTIVHLDDPHLFRTAATIVAKSPILVRAGERKQLVAELAGVRITDTVVCLGAGRAGDVIRVRSLDCKLVRRVRVSDSGSLSLLRGVQ